MMMMMMMKCTERRAVSQGQFASLVDQQERRLL